MEIPVSAAKAHLTDLVRRAEAGDEVILTRHGQPAVRLVPMHVAVPRSARAALIAQVRTASAAKRLAGPDAAHSQDFLYGEDGLPQ